MLQDMFKRGLIKPFHLAVEVLNTHLVEQFETGSDPGTVANRISTTMVPANHILHARTTKQLGGRDAALLEEVMVVVFFENCSKFCDVQAQKFPAKVC